MSYRKFVVLQCDGEGCDTTFEPLNASTAKSARSAASIDIFGDETWECTRKGDYCPDCKEGDDE